MVGTTVAATGARRSTRKGCPNRAVEFKRDLAAAACAPDVSVAKLALEHGVNTNLLFKWRRQYRAGDFGAPDPAHVSAPELPAAPSAAINAVTLLPVHAPATVEADAVAASACIEVVFRSATVRICGAPEIASLRAVLDTLARRS
jgi:transposase